MLYQETMFLLRHSNFKEEVIIVFEFYLDQYVDFEQSNLDSDQSNVDFDQSYIEFD
jgi:hypothetical protein